MLAPDRGRPEAGRPDAASEVEAEIVRVASTITARLPEIAAAMRAVLGDAIAELVGDHRLLDLLSAAIDGNLATVLEMLRDGTPLPQVEVPAAAVEHARRLAQQGVPVFAMVRAYRLGQAHLIEECFAELSRGTDPRLGLRAFNAVNVRVLAYIDWVSQEVVTVYEAERDRWVRSRDAARTARVQEILAGRGGTLADAETALRHRLHQYHVAAVLWVDGDATGEPGDDLEGAADALARRVGAEPAPLAVAVDRATTWLWFARGSRPDDPDVGRAGAALRGLVGARVAFGAAGWGIEGFRESHRQALEARAVLLVGGGPVAIGHREPGVAAAALLAGDLPRARAMVHAVLGPLAADDPSAERLRTTLLAFLEGGSNYTVTAQRHALHKNSVRYRVDRALELRGRPLGDDRIDVELALVACRWLRGGVVARLPDAAGEG